jgi:hypothetical protein
LGIRLLPTLRAATATVFNDGTSPVGRGLKKAYTRQGFPPTRPVRPAGMAATILLRGGKGIMSETSL